MVASCRALQARPVQLRSGIAISTGTELAAEGDGRSGVAWAVLLVFLLPLFTLGGARLIRGKSDREVEAKA
jgi:hypothetical protein